MIQYSLKCREGHQFDSWFQSSEAFDKLHSAGHLSCAVCGDSEISKNIMAPRVAAKTNKQANATLSAPASAAEQAIAQMRKHIEKNATYVGGEFASKAREMHEGVSPEASIYGEARPEEARKLIEDGIPIAPLPFTPKQKSN